MATKKTKLPKPAGMNAQNRIGVLDLNELDDLFDDVGETTKPGDPVTDFKSGLKEGFLGGLKTKDIVRNFLRSAAPDGFARLFGAYDDVMASVTDIKDTVERVNASDLDYLGRKAQDYLPQLKDRIPNALYENISDTLTRKVEQYQYEVDSQRDQIAIRRRRQENDDANVIKAALDQNTLVSRENFQRSEQGAVARAAVERAERGIRDKVSAGRFDFMSRSMGMAVDSLTRLVGYNEQVNYGIQRKGLELQFRTYMGIRDLVKVQEANLELQNKAYEALVRNTGLPDYKKGNVGDLTSFGSGRGRGNMLGRLAGGAAQGLHGFLGSYGNKVNERVASGLGGRLSEIVAGLRMGDMAGSSVWDNRYKFAGQIAGEYGADILKSSIVPWAGRKVRPTMEKLSNRFGGRHHQVGYALDNVPAYLQEFVNNYQNTYGFRGVIRDAIMPFVPQYHMNDRLENGNYQTIDQGAAFNQLTQRSIVEVIPGYLSRQLQELRMIRTGRDDIEREVFDITTGRFEVQSLSDDRLQKKIIPAAAIRSASGAINDTLNLMDEEGKLSPAARKALGERMLRDASTNRRFDPEAYLKSGGYMDGLDATTTDEIQRFFKSKFQYDDKGKMADNAENHRLRDEYSRAFLDIRSVSRDPVKEVHRLINAGQTEPLRMLGIIITEQGQDRINYNRIWEIMRSGVTDTNPWVNGDYQPEASGDMNDKNFFGPAYPGAAKANALNAMRRFRNKHAPQEDRIKKELSRYSRIAQGKFQYLNNKHGAGIHDFANNMRNGQFGPYVAGLQGAWNDANVMGQDLYSKTRAKFGEHMDQFQNDPTQYAIGQKDKIIDVFTKFNPNEPIIKGIDFVQGNLVDFNTKKIIESVHDITGKVVSTTGMTVLTASEVAQGLFDKKGMRLELPAFMSNAADKIRGALMGGQTPPAQQFAEGENAQQKQAAEDDKHDWYLDGEQEPTISARGLKNGEYFNADGDQINSMQDIKGDVLDKNGSIIATAKELASGLWSRATRKRWRLTKTGRRLANVAGWGAKFMATNTSTLAWNALKFGAKTAIGMGSALFNFAIETQNAYLPGDDVPVLERRLVNAGKYFDDKGRVIENFGDVYGTIFNERGEPVIEPSLYKDLKNYDGTKHILAKNKGIIRKTVWRGIRAARSKYIDASMKYMGWALKKTGKFYGGAAKKVLGGFAKAGGNVLGRIFERVPYEDFETTDQVLLGRILETLQAQVPEKLRAGSWQDKAEKAKEGAAGLMDKLKGKGDGDTGKAENKVLKGLSDGLKGIFSKLTGTEGEEGSGAFDVLMGGGMKGGAKGRLMGLAKRAVPWILGGTAAAVGTGAMAYGYSKDGMDAKQTGILTAMSLNPLGQLTARYILKPIFGQMNDQRAEFRRLRMLQYGITDHDQQQKVSALEDAFDRVTERTEEPDFNISGVGGKAILDILGIDVKNEVQVMRMSRWLEMRFRPVFLTWVKALAKLKKNEVKLVDIDSKFPQELKGPLVKAVKISVSGDTPMQYRVDPFSEEGELEDTIPAADQLWKALYVRYKAGEKKDDTVPATAANTEVATKAQDIAKKAADTATGKTAPSPMDPTKSAMPLAAAKKAFPGLGGSTGAPIVATSAATTKLTALQSIRMRAYGLEVLSFYNVYPLLNAEAMVFDGLSIQGGVPEFRGDLESIMQETAPLFGKDIVGNDEDRSTYYDWFVGRFMPVARAYYGAMRNSTQGTTIANMESKLKPSDAVIVGNAVLGVTNWDGSSVWQVDSIFPIKGSKDDLKKMAEADLEQLKKDASKDIMSTPTQSAGDQAAGTQNAAAGGSFAERAMASISNTWESAKETVSNAWSNTKAAGAKAMDYVSDAAANTQYKLGMAGEVSATGRTYGTLTKGNGGAWEQIPYPKANKSRQAAAETFQAVAAMVGIPVELLFIFASLESGFDYTVKAKTSSATGWFQFINSTWDAMLAKHGSKFGIPPDDAQRSLRVDPRINALMGACFLKDNYTYLKDALGRDPTDVDLYIAHFMGPGGARKFLTRNQDTIGASVFPEAASANRPIFYKKGGQPRTLGEIYQMFEEKIAKHRGGAEGSSVATQEAGKTMTPEEATEEQAKANAKASAAELWNTDDSNNAGNAAVAREEAYSATGTAAQTPVLPGITPMNPVGGTTTSGTNPSADSGGNVIQAQQEAALQAAQQQNSTRQAEVRRNNEKAQQIDDIQAEQLKTLIEMRDHLKRLVQLNEQKDSSIKEASKTQAGGNNSMTSTLMRTTAAQNRPSPLSLT